MLRAQSWRRRRAILFLNDRVASKGSPVRHEADPPSPLGFGLSCLLSVGVSAVASDAVDEAWQDNYDARQRYFESAIGPFPTTRDQQWPLAFLQWAVSAEISKDVGLLSRVEQYGGLTVEKIVVGGGNSVNVLIDKAQWPLPTGTTLPAGRMQLLVAVTITDEEMEWSMKNGRRALLDRLREAGIGQISSLSRQSVVKRSARNASLTRVVAFAGDCAV